MLKRVVFITAVFACTLSFLAGCTARLDPVREEGIISFSAGSPLLMDDNTKTGNGSLTESVNDIGDFKVFARRNNDAVNPVFDGVTVTHSGDKWTYEDIQQWNWQSTSDYYDFLAISPALSATSRMDVSGNLAVSTHFDISVDNYDLLYAEYHRQGTVSNPSSVVTMPFKHLTSAVQIVFRNKSDATSVTLNSYKFKNLTVAGDAKVSLDAFGVAYPEWINTERNGSDVRNYTIPGGKKTIAAGSSYSGDEFYNLMIPQRLDQTAGIGNLEVNMPRLFVSYTPEGGSETTAEIVLKSVTLLEDSTTPILTWERGVKYIYYLDIRLDGGVKVTVVTTTWEPLPWEQVEGETPGILI